MLMFLRKMSLAPYSISTSIGSSRPSIKRVCVRNDKDLAIFDGGSFNNTAIFRAETTASGSTSAAYTSVEVIVVKIVNPNSSIDFFQ